MAKNTKTSKWSLSSVLSASGMIVGIVGWIVWVNIIAPMIGESDFPSPIISIGYSGFFVLLFIFSLAHAISVKKNIVRPSSYAVIAVLSCWYAIWTVAGRGLGIGWSGMGTSLTVEQVRIINEGYVIGSIYLLVALVSFFFLCLTIFLFIKRKQKKSL